MRKDNTQNYETPYSKISHFSDFEANKGKSKMEMDKVNRQQISDWDSDYELPNEFRQNWNRVSKKYDSDSKEVVKDKKKSLDSMVDEPKKTFKPANDEINPNHFFKNNTEVVEKKYIKSFEAWSTSFIDDQSIPKFNRTLEKPSSDGSEEEGYSCGCCDDCTGKLGCPCGCEDCTCSSDYDEYDDEIGYDEGVTSYMFFGNLETINKQSAQLMEMNKESVDRILNDGHNWAEDHISATKEMITHVYNFLINQINSVTEHYEGNYMFFANIESIHKMTSELMEMDEDVVDELLKNGHDWAEDHISAAKEDMQQVYDFLKNEIE